MPVYTYLCEPCEAHHSIKKPLSKIDKEESCAICGKVMKRIPSLCSFHLKGSGWYKDGYSKDNTERPG